MHLLLCPFLLGRGRITLAVGIRIARGLSEVSLGLRFWGRGLSGGHAGPELMTEVLLLQDSKDLIKVLDALHLMCYDPLPS